MKLGKLPARHDPRTVRLAPHVAALPPPPSLIDYSLRVSKLGPMLNDQIGDCGLAGPGHYMQCATAENYAEFIPPDAAIQAAYQEVGGYVPGRDETDNGVILLNVMNYWRRTGIAGHKIDGYAALDLRNRELFKQALYLGGGLILGFDLPLTAQSQTRWSLDFGTHDGQAGTWGGHCVNAVAYRDIGARDDGLLVISWGKKIWVSWSFLDAMADEAYVPISRDWADADGAPNGLPIEALRTAIAQVAA